MIIGAVNYVDSGTLTVDDEVASLPGTYLQDRQIVRVWRNTQLTAQIDVDFGQGRILDFLALIKHNISTTGTIRWRLSNVSNFATTVYDSGVVDAWPIVEEYGTLPWGVFSWGGYLNPTVAAEYTISAFDILDNTVQARYLRINISDPSNTDGYLQAGRLLAGPAYRPSINYANGVEFEFVDESRVTKSRGGQTFVDEVERFRRIRFDLINLPENEIFQNVFNQIDRLKGIAGDVFIVPQPDKASTWITQNIYGRITSTDPIVNSSLTYYGRRIEVEELI